MLAMFKKISSLRKTGITIFFEDQTKAEKGGVDVKEKQKKEGSKKFEIFYPVEFTSFNPRA